MDRFNFVRDGMSRLPPGFRFQPTEEELVFQYLKCKVFSCALPASIIPEINVCKYDPWDLPGSDMEEERYLFSNNEAKYGNGRANRSTPSGYWKGTGCDRKIVSSTSRNMNSTVGMKKTLVFYRSKSCGGYSRTGWVMHEYRLVSTETSACISPHLHHSAKNIGGAQMEKWVLCRIFSKKMRMQNDNEVVVHSRIKEMSNERVLGESGGGFYDFIMDSGYVSSTASSSSSSSSVTEITSRRIRSGEEDISSGNSDD